MDFVALTKSLCSSLTGLSSCPFFDALHRYFIDKDVLDQSLDAAGSPFTFGVGRVHLLLGPGHEPLGESHLIVVAAVPEGFSKSPFVWKSVLSLLDLE